MSNDYVLYMRSRNITNKQAADLCAKGYALSKKIATSSRTIIGIEQKGGSK